jgi:hypothetical protein
MHATLSLHPANRAPAVSGVEAVVERLAGGVLALRYRLAGDIRLLAIPAPSASVRADELWRRTCFEAFVRAGEGPAYCELNFSPSSRWAAYRFSGERTGMAPAEVPAVAAACAATGEAVELTASVDLSRALPTTGPWRLGLSAVVEAADGTLSHWALAHPAGRPDFHHPGSFVLELTEPA